MMNKDKSVDGGKFCADCGGRCCKNCVDGTGYFYQSMYLPDFERFTLIELEAIQAVKTFNVWGIGPTDKRHPIHKLAVLLGVEFDPKHGFGGPTGCRLPRNKRSRTCVRYVCPELSKHLGLEEGAHWNWAMATTEEMQSATPIDKYITSLKA